MTRQTRGQSNATSCWLMEEIVGGDKLTKIMQFQGSNWRFVNVRG